MRYYFIVFIYLLAFPAKAQTISTFAGNGVATNSGDGSLASGASIDYPAGLATDKQGNIYIALGYRGNGVRKIDAATGVISRIVGTGTAGYNGDGGLAINAELNTTSEVVLDSAGNIYIADAGNYVVRKVDALTNLISTIAGSGVAGYSGDGGAATSARLNGARGLCVDKHGNLYIGDLYCVRKVNSMGIISTVAGIGVAGYSGDGGLADTSKIYGDRGLATDDSDNLYIADGYAGVRKVNSAGVITTVVGNGVSGSSGDGLPATSAQVVPTRVKFDKFGNMYVTEYPDGNRVRIIRTNGIIQTIAGSGALGFAGDGGPANAAELSQPADITFDTCGNLYIADLDNYRIRKVTFPFCNYLEVHQLSSSIAPHIYPNPAYDQLHVDNISSVTEFGIYNVLGQSVQRGIFDHPDNCVKIDDLPPGLYFLNLMHDKEILKVYKLVKR